MLACHCGGGAALLLEVDGCGDLVDAAALAGWGVAAEPHFDRVWLVGAGNRRCGRSGKHKAPWTCAGVYVCMCGWLYAVWAV